MSDGTVTGSMSLQLDARLTFDSYIVGTSNRLAAAAARRVADAPGHAYNPLVVYGASGLGKTHLVMAIGNHLQRVQPELGVIYDTLEHLMESVMGAIHAGERDAFRARLGDAVVLLLDDIQFLAGRHAVQEELLRAWDGLLVRGGQIVLASDRPPHEIDDLDQRLLSRFSGGLVVDLSAPDYETRVAIVRRKAEERGQQLSDGVAEALARASFTNVRELQGGLHRVLVVQELDGRVVNAGEVAQLLGLELSPPAVDEFSSFLEDIAGTLSEVVSQVRPEQKVADTIVRWEGDGYRTRRLELALADTLSHDAADALIARFEADTARLRELAAEIERLDPGAPELRRDEVLRNPDRVADAEALVEYVRQRMRPLPAPPPAPGFAQLELDPQLLAVRAARAIAEQPGTRYNPFFVHGAAGGGKTALVTALSLRFTELHAEAPVAFVSGDAFAAELIDALTHNSVDSWRARYRRARLLVIDGVDALMDTERAQEELFHLFDEACRAGAQLVFTAPVAARDLTGFEERLRTRLGSGLVVDMLPAAVATDEAAALLAHEPAIDEFFCNREKLLWEWPYLQDSVVQELD